MTTRRLAAILAADEGSANQDQQWKRSLLVLP
jgi:hypothetical protein